MPNIEVRQDVYDRLKAKTNNEGGRSPKKVGMGQVIDYALDAYEKQKKIKITSERKYIVKCDNCDNKDKMCVRCMDKNKFHGWLV